VAYAPASASGATTAVPVDAPRNSSAANMATAVARSRGTTSVDQLCRVVCRNAHEPPRSSPAAITVAMSTVTAGTTQPATSNAPPTPASPAGDSRPTSIRTSLDQASEPTPNADATSPATAAEAPRPCTAGAR
jgi:hypothetical protein